MVSNISQRSTLATLELSLAFPIKGWSLETGTKGMPVIGLLEIGGVANAIPRPIKILMIIVIQFSDADGLGISGSWTGISSSSSSPRMILLSTAMISSLPIIPSCPQRSPVPISSSKPTISSRLMIFARSSRLIIFINSAGSLRRPLVSKLPLLESMQTQDHNVR